MHTTDEELSAICGVLGAAAAGCPSVVQTLVGPVGGQTIRALYRPVPGELDAGVVLAEGLAEMGPPGLVIEVARWGGPVETVREIGRLVTSMGQALPSAEPPRVRR